MKPDPVNEFSFCKMNESHVKLMNKDFSAEWIKASLCEWIMTFQLNECKSCQMTE